MRCEIEITRPFERCIKALKKKYPHVKADLEGVFPKLRENPEAGDCIPGFEERVWKLRVASRDIKKGKRGGYRLIYYWRKDSPKLYLVFVYAKVRKVDITKRVLERFLREILESGADEEGSQIENR